MSVERGYTGVGRGEQQIVALYDQSVVWPLEMLVFLTFTPLCKRGPKMIKKDRVLPMRDAESRRYRVFAFFRNDALSAHHANL